VIAHSCARRDHRRDNVTTGGGACYRRAFFAFSSSMRPTTRRRPPRPPPHGARSPGRPARSGVRAGARDTRYRYMSGRTGTSARAGGVVTDRTSAAPWFRRVPSAYPGYTHRRAPVETALPPAAPRRAYPVPRGAGGSSFTSTLAARHPLQRPAPSSSPVALLNENPGAHTRTRAGRPTRARPRRRARARGRARDADESC